MKIIKKFIICCLTIFTIISFIYSISDYVFGATATTKSGYYYIQISGDGYTTKRKINIKLSSTNLNKSQTVTISEGSVSRLF